MDTRLGQACVVLGLTCTMELRFRNFGCRYIALALLVRVLLFKKPDPESEVASAFGCFELDIYTFVFFYPDPGRRMPLSLILIKSSSDHTLPFPSLPPPFPCQMNPPLAKSDRRILKESLGGTRVSRRMRRVFIGD